MLELKNMERLIRRGNNTVKVELIGPEPFGKANIAQAVLLIG